MAGTLVSPLAPAGDTVVGPSPPPPTPFSAPSQGIPSLYKPLPGFPSKFQSRLAGTLK